MLLILLLLVSFTNDTGELVFISTVFLIVWIILIFCQGSVYKSNLISHQRIDENIALVQEQTIALDEKIKSIEIKGSLSLGDSPYKSIIETYNKNMESLLYKKEKKIDLEKYILSSEIGMFRHTNKFLVKKELIIKK